MHIHSTPGVDEVSNDGSVTGEKLPRMRFTILTNIEDVGSIAFVGCNIQILIRLVIPLRLNSSTVLNVSFVSIYHISIVSF